MEFRYWLSSNLTYCNFLHLSLIENIIRIISRDSWELSETNIANLDFFIKFFSKKKMLLFSQFWSDVAGLRTCPYFFGSDKVYQISIQSDNYIDTYWVYDLLLQTDRQSRKNRFFWLRGSQKVKIWWKLRKSFLTYN